MSKEGMVEAALLGASSVRLYHTHHMSFTFRRDIRMQRSHPRAQPTLWSPLRKPHLPALSDVPAPSPPQHPKCPAATPSNLDPCPGRLAQPHYHEMTIITRQRCLEAATSPPCVT